MNETKDLKTEKGMPVTENKMGYMPIRPLMISMSLPAIISMTINALYNIVDSYFVARISEDALTAVSIIMPLQLMIIAVGVGTGVGINSLISRRLGARRQEDADKAATTGIILGVCNWLVFMLVGLILPGAFVSAYAKPGTYIYEAATQYLMIVFCGSFFIFVQVNLEKILQATGNMKAPMICSMSGAITNVILDPIMIFGLLGFPKLGVVGAAIATVIGQVVGFTIGVCILFGGKNHLVNIRFKGFRPEKRIIKEIYQVALPSIIMQSIASVMNVLYNMILVAYSTTAVAVLGVYFKIQSFVFMPVFGLNQGVLPIIGFNYGARNKERVKEARKEGIRLALFFMVIGLILFQTIPDKLLLIFDASPKMLEYGVPALRIISLNFIPAAFGIMNGTVFQATGHGVYSLICSSVLSLPKDIRIVPFAYLLAKIGGVTLSWFSFPIGEVLGLIYSFAMLNKLMKNEIDAL